MLIVNIIIMHNIIYHLHGISSSSFVLLTFIVMNFICIVTNVLQWLRPYISFQDDFVFRNKLLYSYKKTKF